MAEIADIVLNDSVPAARTFVPSYKSGLLVGFQEETPVTPSLFPKITVGMRAEKAGTNRKVTIKIVVPYLAGGPGPDDPDIAATAFIDLVVPTEVAAATISDLRAYASDLLLNSIIAEITDTGKFPY